MTKSNVNARWDGKALAPEHAAEARAKVQQIWREMHEDGTVIPGVQQIMADQLGICKSTISRWLNNGVH